MQDQPQKTPSSPVPGYPPQRQSPRYEMLDAWRGVACLLVVMFHACFYANYTHYFSFQLPGTWLINIYERWWAGVAFFFVISGYCITATTDSSRRKGLGIGSYFYRRVRRIFPPYLICVAIFAPIVGGLDYLHPQLFHDGLHDIPRPWWLDGWQIFGNLTLTEGWRHHIAGSPSRWFLGHAWTLGYEEQFYGVTGLLFLLCARHLFVGAIVVSLFTLAVAGFAPTGFFFDGYWLYYAAGVLVYYATVYGERRHVLLYAMPLVAGLIWVFWTPHELLTSTSNPRQFAFAAFSFALLILWLRPYDAQLCAHAVTRPLLFCGKMCYSLYLVHWPLCKLVSHVFWLAGVDSAWGTALITVPACLAVSIAAGYAFYLGVERRFLNTPAPQLAPRPAIASTS